MATPTPRETRSTIGCMADKTLHFRDLVGWIETALDPVYPRELVFDLALVALGQRAQRTAAPLLEAGARLSVDDLGRIARLYVEGLDRRDKGYRPLLGAANLARKLLANPDVPKFAVMDRLPEEKGRAPSAYSTAFKGVLSLLAARIRSNPDDRVAKIYHQALSTWAKTASEQEIMLFRRAMEHFRRWLPKEEIPRVAFELWREVHLLRRYLDYNPSAVEVKAKVQLPKELREIRA